MANRETFDVLPPLTARDLKTARFRLAEMWRLTPPLSALEMASILGFSSRDNYLRYEREGAEATGPMSAAVRGFLAGYRPPNAPADE